MAAIMPHGYRSATEYRFDEEQADDIHAGIRPSIAISFPRAPNTGLGSLNRLPLELLHDTLSQYQAAVSHGLNLFCAFLRTRLSVGVSLPDLHDALCTKACTFCGDFGGFVSLLGWNRCCFPCLQKALETQVRSLAAVRKQFHLTKTDLSQLRSFKTLPGTYMMEDSVQKSRITVVSVHQALLVSGQQPHSPEAMVQQASSARNQKLNFMGAVEHGMSCAGGGGWASEARDKVYAQDGFLDHFRWCEQAQLLWRSSGEGKHKPPELPEGARRRGYFNNGG
ncbi:cyclin-like F-box [Podospora aff. communis PSN243]|uniref:Cyclin-like F-box n=1 Tax=Podospora aff. communis PSN243 TaxID=3040156 RepID=A0AAV9GFC8_9PEZI|nr:cyclin-like F-box [Podospora aff. communis PSN243]